MEENCIYHIYNRGINRANIFFEERNYQFFLKRFDKYLAKFTKTLCYCLMPNHFHFLLRVNEISKTNSQIFNESNQKSLTSLEQAFRDFFISYAKAVNNAYERTGALFQYKFKRKIIKDQNYLTKLIAYIHLNPVRAKLCNYQFEWKHSSYNSILSNRPTRILRDEVLCLFGGRNSFIEFHENYIKLIIRKKEIFCLNSKTTKSFF